jgi:hypothetical protein
MYLVFRCIDFFYLMGYVLYRQLHITLKCTGKVVGKRDQTDKSPKPERAANWDPNKREEFIDCFIQDNRLTDICEMANLLEILIHETVIQCALKFTTCFIKLVTINIVLEQIINFSSFVCSEKRNTDSDISLEELYNYFKDSNSYEENDAEHVPNANDINLVCSLLGLFGCSCF